MFKIEDFKVGDKVILKEDGSVYDDLWVDESVKGELVEVVQVFGAKLEVKLASTGLRQVIFLTHILRKVDNSNVTTFAELLKYFEGFRYAGGDMETKIEYLIVKESK